MWSAPGKCFRPSAVPALYTADVIVIAQRHGFLALSYVDDTQLYFHDKASSVETRLQRLKDCISEIDR